jgi:hypothetical protein
MSSTPPETSNSTERGWIYVVSVILLVGLVVAGLLAFSSARSTARAQDKADELIAAIEESGRTAPSQDQIVRVLGEDGGAVCQDPNAALKKAVLFEGMTNGAGGPGMRPVIADSRVVQGELLIMEVYCPDELEEFQQFVDQLEFDDVAGG